MQRRAAALRYELARRMTGGGLLVDVACGTGFGVEHVRGAGARAVGGDLSAPNLQRARSHAPDTPWIQLDAQDMPFRDGAADAVACFEALYYLPRPEAFLTEAHRVLRPGGHLVVSVPNPRRPGFSLSPGSVAYFDPSELFVMLSSAGFDTRVLGAFRRRSGVSDGARRVLVRAGLMPRTIAGRARLKGLLERDMKPLAPLETIDALLDELTPLLPNGPSGPEFTVLYAIGQKSRADGRQPYGAGSV
jgi:SAM-dependent methyltransferase